MRVINFVLQSFSPILDIASYQLEEYYDGTKVNVNQLSYTQFISFYTFYHLLRLLYILFILCSQVNVCFTSVENFWSSVFFLSSITLFFLIPLIILIVLYSVIAKHLMANPQIISTHSRRNFLKYRKQVILMLAAVVVSFFTCLLPFKAFTLWVILIPADTLNGLLRKQKSECD